MAKKSEDQRHFDEGVAELRKWLRTKQHTKEFCARCIAYRKEEIARLQGLLGQETGRDEEIQRETEEHLNQLRAWEHTAKDPKRHYEGRICFLAAKVAHFGKKLGHHS